MYAVNFWDREANFHDAEARCHEAEDEAEARYYEAEVEAECVWPLGLNIPGLQIIEDNVNPALVHRKLMSAAEVLKTAARTDA